MKNFTTNTRISAFFLATIILLSSCASTTLIDTVPSGANLYLDGEYVGVTPQYMTDSKLIGTCTTVRIEKDNYRNFHTTICRTEEPDAGAIIGGIFFFFPFFWAMKYKPTHFYKLQPALDKEGSLDQLLMPDNKVKNNKMSVEEPSLNSKTDGIIRLEEGNEITPEEFEQQKAVKPE